MNHSPSRVTQLNANKQTEDQRKKSEMFSGVLLQSSAAHLVIFTRIISPCCCSLVSLGFCQTIFSFCFQPCSVRSHLLLRLLVLSALSRHVSQPLLVVTTEPINLDQVVVSGLVLGLIEGKKDEGQNKEGTRRRGIT